MGMVIVDTLSRVKSTRGQGREGGGIFCIGAQMCTDFCFYHITYSFNPCFSGSYGPRQVW